MAASTSTSTSSSTSASPSGSEKSEEGNPFQWITAAELGKHLSTSGVAVCVATGVTHPLDVVKVRLQLERMGQKAELTGMKEKFLQVVQNEGLLSLYQGLAPALLRSAVYGCLRLGLYEPCKIFIEMSFDCSNVLTKLVAGAISGSIATATTNPLDVLKVRLQAQHNILHGGLSRELSKIVATEGISGLWKGVGPSMARASALTASQLATYEESKQLIRHVGTLEEGFWLHLSASFVAGFIGTATTAPIDTVKTRLMMQRATSSTLYKSSFDCAYKILMSEGLQGLYKGWSALFARLGPQTAIIFLVYEKMRQLAGMHAL